MKNVFRKTLTGILCIVIFIMSTGCSSVVTDPVEQVIDAINSSEYLTANEIYFEKISGNLQLENEVENQLSELISNAIESYNNGETSYDEAKLILNVIDRADIYSSSLLSVFSKELSELQTSKKYYEEAVSLEESGEYLDAYEAYEQVSSDDSNYEFAQTKSEEVLDTLLESLIAEADELVANGDYETAYINLYSCQNLYSESDEFWDELDLIYYSCMDAVIADAKALVAESNYSGACAVLYNEYDYFEFDGEDLYDAEVTKVVSLWEAVVIDEAEEAFGSDKDYEAAILVLQHSGLSSDNIDAKIAEYQEYAPIALTSLDYTRKGDCIWVGTSLDYLYTDVNGNTYDNNNIICQYSWDSSGDEHYVLYSLNSEYSSLTGTIFRTYKSLNCKDLSEWVWYSDVKIYGDGVLLYEFSDITRDTYDTTDFEIDITGVGKLEIVVKGMARNEYFFGWTDYTTLCLANLIISK